MFYIIETENLVEGMFMVMDQEQLSNTPPTVLKKFRPALVYNIQNKHTLFRFFLIVRKLYNIIIKINNTSSNQRYTVFDGPGLFSDIINVTNIYARTSTFQCVVVLLTPIVLMPQVKEVSRMTRVSSDLTSYTGSFTYISKVMRALNRISLNNINNKVIQFPNTKCQKMCVFQ